MRCFESQHESMCAGDHTLISRAKAFEVPWLFALFSPLLLQAHKVMLIIWSYNRPLQAHSGIRKCVVTFRVIYANYDSLW